MIPALRRALASTARRPDLYRDAGLWPRDTPCHPEGLSAAAFRHVMEQGIPFNKALGLELVEEDSWKGKVVLRMPFQESIIGDPSRPAIHGGAVAALIDAAAGFAAWSTLPSARRLSTIDLRVDYLQPNPPKDLIANAVVTRAGRKVIFVDVLVLPADRSGENEAVCARGRANFHVDTSPAYSRDAETIERAVRDGQE